jgi:hypothetical protein
MHCELQLEKINAIDANNRVLHVVASGGLCKITNNMNDQYQQVINNCFLLKDLSNYEGTPGIVVNETITSRQDTTRIGEMFYLLKCYFKKVFDSALSFKYVVSDLSWATIHACLEILNLETTEDYGRRIFNFANKVSNQGGMCFLSSCVSHTTHRFTRGLKRQVAFEDCEQKEFACFLYLSIPATKSTARRFSV